MKNLRSRRVAGKTALQTPLIRLRDPRSGRTGLLVLTAHLGDGAYFETLRKDIDADGGRVFFEAVRSNSEDPEHWRDPYHRFLKGLRREVYEGLSRLGLLEFQGQRLAPEPGWTNADVDCCTLADRLRRAKVSLWRFEMALSAFRRLIAQAEAGDTGARASLDRTIRWGLVFVSFGAIFRVVQFLPSTRRLYRVINDWRSASPSAPFSPRSRNGSCSSTARPTATRS